ncbi:hypothetical protein [Rhizobium sp. HT1-10]|uniref:hypothetical protein n=1 Tax=Rhizobium sp. HT1-10 TaxID=3111638 RepID=UPI003C2A975E
MADDPKDVIMPMLREMRAEMREQFQDVKERLDKLESRQKTVRQALTADTMMSRLVAGDFEDRIFELERKIDMLMKGK